MPYNAKNVGYRNTDTSEGAADKVDASTIRGKVLDALNRNTGPRTSEELAKLVGLPYGSVQPRLSELRNAGKVVDSGIRKRGRFGKMIIAWDTLRSGK